MTEEKMITVPKRLLLDLLKSIPEEMLEELLQELNLEQNGSILFPPELDNELIELNTEAQINSKDTVLWEDFKQKMIEKYD